MGNHHHNDQNGTSLNLDSQSLLLGADQHHHQQKWAKGHPNGGHKRSPSGTGPREHPLSTTHHGRGGGGNGGRGHHNNGHNHHNDPMSFYNNHPSHSSHTPSNTTTTPNISNSGSRGGNGNSGLNMSQNGPNSIPNGVNSPFKQLHPYTTSNYQSNSSSMNNNNMSKGFGTQNRRRQQRGITIDPNGQNNGQNGPNSGQNGPNGELMSHFTSDFDPMESLLDHTSQEQRLVTNGERGGDIGHNGNNNNNNTSQTTPHNNNNNPHPSPPLLNSPNLNSTRIANTTTPLDDTDDGQYDQIAINAYQTNLETASTIAPSTTMTNASIISQPTFAKAMAQNNNNGGNILRKTSPFMSSTCHIIDDQQHDGRRNNGGGKGQQQQPSSQQQTNNNNKNNNPKPQSDPNSSPRSSIHQPYPYNSPTFSPLNLASSRPVGDHSPINSTSTNTTTTRQINNNNPSQQQPSTHPIISIMGQLTPRGGSAANSPIGTPRHNQQQQLQQQQSQHPTNPHDKSQSVVATAAYEPSVAGTIGESNMGDGGRGDDLMSLASFTSKSFNR